MNQFIDTSRQHLQSLVDFLPVIFYATIVFAVFIFIGRIVAAVVDRGFKRAEFSETYQAFFLKIVRWLFGIIGFLLALKIMGLSGLATSILAGGGVTAIVLGFAFRDIGENILAGFFLAFSRPFKIGDLIRSEDFEGRVRSVELRHTHIRTADGCDIFIPSAQIFTRPLLNFTRDGLRRITFTIGIDYGDDAKKAADILLNTVSENEQIIKNPAPKVHISGFTPNYVELKIFFWINTFKQEEIMAELRNQAMNACRTRLLDEDFTLSSSVTTALSMAPLTVNVDREE